MKALSLSPFWTKLILLGILVAAAVLFTIGYNFSIPILSKDEGWMLGTILEQRGLANVADLPGYPPVILLTYTLATNLVEMIKGGDVLTLTGDIVILIRLSYVFINLLSLGFVFGIAKHLSNSFAALLAAFVWMLAPGIFEHIRLALSEAWLLMFISGSMYFMLETLDKKRAWLAIASTGFGLLAIATKYNVAPVLGFGVVAVLYLAWKDNRSWLKVFGVQILLILFWAYLLLFGYGAIGMLQSGRPTATNFMESGLEQLSNLRLSQKVFSQAAQVLSLRLILAVAVLLIGGGIYLWKSEVSKRIAWVLILGFAIFTTWFVSSYLTFQSITDRYVAAAASAWLVVIVVAIVAIFQIFPAKGYGYLAQAAFALFLLIFWLVPMFQERIRNIETFLKTDSRVSFSEWSSVSLPSGTIALDGQHWYIFDPVWGGYQRVIRPWVARERWLERPLEDWLAADIRYVQLNGAYPGDASILPFDNIYYLKSIPAQGEEARWTGDNFYIYRVVSSNFVEVNLAFENGMSLAAYELSGREFAAGETLELQTYWRAAQVPSYDYQVFLHLVPLDSFEPITQLDLSPAIRPSTSWTDSAETLVGNNFQLSIPSELEAGNYRLILGLYRLDNFERLRTVAGLDYLEIAQIQIRN